MNILQDQGPGAAGGLLLDWFFMDCRNLVVIIISTNDSRADHAPFANGRLAYVYAALEEVFDGNRSLQSSSK